MNISHGNPESYIGYLVEKFWSLEYLGTDMTGTEYVRTDMTGTEKNGTDMTGTEKTGTEKSLHRNDGDELTATKRRRPKVVHPIPTDISYQSLIG